MEAGNIYMNASMRPALHFADEIIEGLALRGYAITHIITTTALKPQKGEPSLKIEYRISHQSGAVMLLDFEAVIMLSVKAALA